MGRRLETIALLSHFRVKPALFKSNSFRPIKAGSISNVVATSTTMYQPGICFYNFETLNL